MTLKQGAVILYDSHKYGGGEFYQQPVDFGE